MKNKEDNQLKAYMYICLTTGCLVDDNLSIAGKLSKHLQELITALQSLKTLDLLDVRGNQISRNFTCVLSLTWRMRQRQQFCVCRQWTAAPVSGTTRR